VSKYFELEDGQVLDYHFKKMDNGWCQFLVGDRPVGIVTNTERRGQGWAVVTVKDAPNWHLSLTPVYGFKSRMDAVQYMLKVRRKAREDAGTEEEPGVHELKAQIKAMEWKLKDLQNGNANHGL
jgi:hypothetical protein